MKVSIVSVFKTTVFIIVLAALCVGAYAAYMQVPDMLKGLTSEPVEAPEVQPGKDVIVNIPKGASLSQVGAILHEKGVISSRLVFKLVAMIRGEQRKIQAGEYSLKTGSDAGVVLDQLISGKTLMLPFTVPEGYTIFQTAEVFQQAGIMSAREFMTTVRDKKFIKGLGLGADTLEGYLFPDTYFLKPSEMKDGKKLIARMVNEFRRVYDAEVGPIAEKNGWTMNQVVTLASLIEKEARAHEHGKVSAVFHNRLRKRMRLQSDPTVIYGIKPMGAPITRSDLKKKHPYNTYQNFGLPPGPIASPGRASLVAAVKPEPVDYLYFVAKNDGTHQFSKTLKEHNRWVNLYQRSHRKQSRNTE